jgi:hypothetical protein
MFADRVAAAPPTRGELLIYGEKSTFCPDFYPFPGKKIPVLAGLAGQRMD